MKRYMLLRRAGARGNGPRSVLWAGGCADRRPGPRCVHHAVYDSRRPPRARCAHNQEWRSGLERNYGLAQVDPAVPVTDETLFMLASISKTITSVAVLQLWEDGCS